MPHWSAFTLACHCCAVWVENSGSSRPSLYSLLAYFRNSLYSSVAGAYTTLPSSSKLKLRPSGRPVKAGMSRSRMVVVRPTQVKGISSLGSPLPFASCSLKATSISYSSSVVSGTLSTPTFFIHSSLKNAVWPCTVAVWNTYGRP